MDIASGHGVWLTTALGHPIIVPLSSRLRLVSDGCRVGSGRRPNVHRNEHREEPRGLADLLLPFAIIDDGILLQQDGSLLAGWTYRGPDMMSASAAEMDALSARLNSAMRLG